MPRRTRRTRLRRLVSDEASAPFDLEHGPLVRGRLVRMAADDHVLLLTMHHIVSDGWSMGVLHRELGALYAAFVRGQADPLPPLPVQYADYAAWQRRWVEGDVLQRQADYWRETLAGAPELLELPTDRPRPARQDFAGASLKVELDEALTAGLKTLGARHGATLSHDAARRMGGRARPAVGPGRRRRRHPERQPRPERDRGSDRLLRQHPRAARGPVGRAPRGGAAGAGEGAFAGRSAPPGHPLRAGGGAGAAGTQPGAHPAVPGDVRLAERAAGAAWSCRGWHWVRWTPSASSQVSAKFDLSLVLWEDGGRIEGAVEYATALFERETVERWLGYLRRVLEGMVADERESAERLELLPAAERRRVVEEFNDRRAKDPREAFVHERFEAQVERTPGAAALVFEDETLSYAELNARANRLAHHLRSLGVGPDARVGICVERSLEMVVGVLAVLKAGGAYVPLDPALPGGAAGVHAGRQRPGGGARADAPA